MSKYLIDFTDSDTLNDFYKAVELAFDGVQDDFILSIKKWSQNTDYKQDEVIFYIITNQFLKAKVDFTSGTSFNIANWDIIETGATEFIALNDTPADYTGQNGKYLVVNGTEDGLQFIDLPTFVTDFISLTDTPSDYTGQSGKILVVNATEDAIEFIAVESPAIKISDLNFTRNLYTSTTTYNDSGAKNYNIALGYLSLNTLLTSNVISMNDNIAIGRKALYSLGSSSTDNISIGQNSLELTTGCSYNIALGYNSARRVSGSRNIAIGFNAMGTTSFNLIGDDNIAIGREAMFSANFSGCVSLGDYSTVTGDNQIQLGDSGTTTYAYGPVQDRSDVRDKADIREQDLGLSFIMALKPKKYKWDYREDYTMNIEREEYESIKNSLNIEEILEETDEYVRVKLVKDGSKKRNREHNGLIAQDVEQLCNELKIDFAGLQHHLKNGGEDVYSLGYNEFISPIIKAIQELKSENDSLKNEINIIKQHLGL